MNQLQRHKKTPVAGYIRVAMLLINLLPLVVFAAGSEKQVVISEVIVKRDNIFDANAVSGQDTQQQTARLLSLIHI